MAGFLMPTCLREGVTIIRSKSIKRATEDDCVFLMSEADV